MDLFKLCVDFDYCGNVKKDFGLNGKMFNLFVQKSV